MKYKITYVTRTGEEKSEILETEETKERLMQHAHMRKVEVVKGKVAKKVVKKTEEKK